MPDTRRIGALRVLQLHSVDDFGGAEVMSLEVFPRFDRSRFTIEFAFGSPEGDVGRRLASAGFTVHHVPSRSILQLARLARRGKYEIAHFYGFRLSLKGRAVFRVVAPRTELALGVRGLQIVEREHTDDLVSRCVLRVERLFSLLTARYVSNSIGAIELLAAAGIPREKFRYVPNGLPGSQPPTARPPADVPIIVCAARFVPRKRHADLIEVLAALSRRCSFRAVLIGYGPELDTIRCRARDFGVADSIEFTGRLSPEETIGRLATADVFVLLSEWEGMSRGVLEAMAVGLPVVGTDVNGIGDLIVDGQTGFKVALGDIAHATDSLAALVADKDLRRAMGEAARDRIRAEYSVDRTVSELTQVYLELADRSMPAVDPH
jgi:glycosyltransferase involved in cell wall biosynthesis